MDFSVNNCLGNIPMSDLGTMLPNKTVFQSDNLVESSSRLKKFVNELLWVHLIVIILASFSLFSSWRYITKFSYKFMDEKDKRKKIKRVI